jgi:hypothetical protein
MRSLPLPLLLLAAAAGCTDTTTSPFVPTGSFAVVTTSGGFGAGGAVNTVRLSDKTIFTGLDTTIDQDNAVRVANSKAYVLNRTPGSLFVYDTTSWKNPVEIETGDATQAHNKSNPQDVLAVPGSTKLYVSMMGFDGAHAVGVLDSALPQKGVIRWIAIANAAADKDGNPEATSLYYCQGRVYVLLQDLDQMTFSPSGNGRIASIDVTSDTVLGYVQLQAQNPYAIAQASMTDCNQVLVADSGPYGLAPDGTAGIERVSLASSASLGLLFKDTDIAGRPSTVSVRSQTLAFSAIYFDLQPTASGPRLQSSKVIAFNPSTGKVLGDVTTAAAFIPFTAIAPDGSLMVGVDAYPGSMSTGKLAGGLYVGPGDGTKLTGAPLNLGQNPYAIAFQ